MSSTEPEAETRNAVGPDSDNGNVLIDDGCRGYRLQHKQWQVSYPFKPEIQFSVSNWNAQCLSVTEGEKFKWKIDTEIAATAAVGRVDESETLNFGAADIIIIPKSQIDSIPFPWIFPMVARVEKATNTQPTIHHIHRNGTLHRTNDTESKKWINGKWKTHPTNNERTAELGQVTDVCEL